MANSADGSTWIAGSPQITDPRRDGAQEIRGLRAGVKSRVDKEHVALAADHAGGEHKAGSVKVFTGAVAPTTRPDGSTPLNADDKGRLWVDDDNLIYIWDGSDWVEFAADVPFEPQHVPENSIADAKATFESSAGWTNGPSPVSLYLSLRSSGATSVTLDIEHRISGAWRVFGRVQVGNNRQSIVTLLVGATQQVRIVYISGTLVWEITHAKAQALIA